MRKKICFRLLERVYLKTVRILSTIVSLHNLFSVVKLCFYYKLRIISPSESNFFERIIRAQLHSRTPHTANPFYWGLPIMSSKQFRFVYHRSKVFWMIKHFQLDTSNQYLTAIAINASTTVMKVNIWCKDKYIFSRKEFNFGFSLF